jgi:hypothetical protein
VVFLKIFHRQTAEFFFHVRYAYPIFVSGSIELINVMCNKEIFERLVCFGLLSPQRKVFIIYIQFVLGLLALCTKVLSSCSSSSSQAFES